MTQIEFNSLVAESTKTLKPFAINLTRDSEAADDLLQETVYRALVNHDKFSEGTNLKAWLFTIMRNIFINNYRRMVKRNTIIDTTDNMYYLNSSASVTKNQAVNDFVMEDLQRAVTSLSDEYRVPFVMHYEGYKYHEIADHLKLPLGTVKSRIFFARKELKAFLKKMQFTSHDDHITELPE
jgi:RNA polymerase sigma-70 factor (ECF subfamily)